jgi:MATE family multidrug resistance protein
MMGMLGSVPVAANAVAMNLISITFMIPHGIGAAASTRVGNLIGATLSWRSAAWLAVGTGVAWMAVTSIVLAVVPESLALVFTREVEVVALAAALLPVAAAFQLFDGVQVVIFGVLRGAGDTRVPAVVNLVGYWVCGLPLAYWLGVYHQWGPQWVWGGLVVGLAVVALSLVVRLRWVMDQDVSTVDLNHPE